MLPNIVEVYQSEHEHNKNVKHTQSLHINSNDKKFEAQGYSPREHNGISTLPSENPSL